jgi:hypothetical protein
MISRIKIRQWLAVVIVLAVSSGLLWMAITFLDTAVLDAARSKAAHQRSLTPLTP